MGKKLLTIFTSCLLTLSFEGVSYSNENYHVVIPGDTLYSISRKTNVSVDKIISINSIEDNQIKLGQKLYLGKKESKDIVEKSSNKDFVIVKPGDTLYSIARDNNLSFSYLVDTNNMKYPYSIDINQKIYLKKSSLTTSHSLAKSDNKIIRSVRGFILPVKGNIISDFSNNLKNRKNRGVNIAGKEGDSIVASKDGIVSYSGSNFPGFGNTVILSHKGGYKTIYSHNKSNLVMKGELIKQGEKIATVGKTGKVSIPQVHFEIRKDGTAIDPSSLIK
jgi:murein DD-endopeptidase MepM/ murein hydrolase activator NlpD